MGVPISGRLLTGPEILARLEKGEIFRPGTWDPRSVRATGYDLRIASDQLITPNSRGGSRQYLTGEMRAAEIILHSGDVAVATSREKLCFPWDLSGLIGTKFGLSAKAILTLTGTIVDPGYGLQLVNGEWVDKDNARLHFMLANVGPGPVSLIPGQTRIAVLQFFEVEPPATKQVIDSGGYREIQDRFFDSAESDAGLEFFHQIKAQSETQGAQIRDIATKMDVMEKSSNLIVMFGLYLMFATFLGVALAFSLSVIRNGHQSGEGYDLVAQPWLAVPLFVVIVLLASAGVLLIVGSSWNFVRMRLSHSRVNSPAAPTRPITPPHAP